MHIAFTKQLSIAVIASAVALPVIADTASDINSANRLVREQKFDEAIVEYRAVAPTDVVKDDLDYNLAVAEYRRGEIESAKAMFTEASTSSDAKLAAAARYNLGNCFYTDAVTAAEKDKSAAIEALRKAIGHYRASLAGNPNFVDARANIELAVELMKKLQQQNQEQQQQKQDQEQKDQEQQQDRQSKAKQDQQKQDSESKSDKSQKDQQQKDQEQQGQGSESKDKSSQEQSGDQDKSKSDEQQAAEGQRSEQKPSKDESGQSQESEDQPGKDAQPKPDQSSKEERADQQKAGESGQMGKQQSNARQSEQQPKGDSSEGQQPEADDQPAPGADLPAGELKGANQHDANEKQNVRVAMADPNAKEGLMSKEEALKMLQAVRDRDMLRRLRHEQVERSRHIQTDRDW